MLVSCWSLEDVRMLLCLRPHRVLHEDQCYSFGSQTLTHRTQTPSSGTRKETNLMLDSHFPLTSGSYISSLLLHTTNLQMDSSCLPSSLGTFSDMYEPVGLKVEV